jgi:hypothetical protein
VTQQALIVGKASYAVLPSFASPCGVLVIRLSRRLASEALPAIRNISEPSDLTNISKLGGRFGQGQTIQVFEALGDMGWPLKNIRKALRIPMVASRLFTIRSCPQGRGRRVQRVKTLDFFQGRR